MRWYEYKMETDDLYAPDDLKAKLLAMTDQLTEEEKAQPMMKTDAPVPAQSAPVQPKKKLIRFPAKRVGALAACLAVCVVGYGAFATGQIGLGAKSSSPAAVMAAGGADRAAVDSPMAADYSLNTLSLEKRRRQRHRCLFGGRRGSSGPQHRPRKDHLHREPQPGKQGLRRSPRCAGCCSC